MHPCIWNTIISPVRPCLFIQDQILSSSICLYDTNCIIILYISMFTCIHCAIAVFHTRLWVGGGVLYARVSYQITAITELNYIIDWLLEMDWKWNMERTTAAVFVCHAHHNIVSLSHRVFLYSRTCSRSHMKVTLTLQIRIVILLATKFNIIINIWVLVVAGLMQFSLFILLFVSFNHLEHTTHQIVYFSTRYVLFSLCVLYIQSNNNNVLIYYTINVILIHTNRLGWNKQNHKFRHRKDVV